MDKDKIKGKAKDIAGRVERQAGEWAGSEEHQVKDAVEQTKGKAQSAVGRMKDVLRKAADDRDRDRNIDENIDERPRKRRRIAQDKSTRPKEGARSGALSLSRPPRPGFPRGRHENACQAAPRSWRCTRL